EDGERTLPLQAKLLRVLEHQQLERLGDSRTVAVDVRLIAATHRPLEEMVECGEFREDLYYRLRRVSIDVPPLRQRREDIPLLAAHFLREANETHSKRIDGISRGALDVLMRYDWPGNVRELKNIVEGAVIMGRNGKSLDVSDIPEHVRRHTTPEVSE